MVEVFGPLSARPPTPPRTTPRALSEKDRLQNSPIVAQTPLSANIPNGPASSRQSKRVNFSPWNTFEASPEPELKVPPPYESKPTKSILKATSSPATANLSSVLSHTPESFAMLLESLTQQLAGESISSRVDAYMQFFGALRAYDDLPTEREIIDKLGLITQFIQRDVSSRGFENNEPLQTNLVVQALKLASALLWQNDVAPHIPDEFKVFLVDRSLNGLQEERVPKTVLSHYLSILSSQNAHAKFMTVTRQTRLLTLLHDLTNRVTGSAILAQRLSIYTRILHSNKSLFLSHAPHWMEHLVSGCLHHLKDIRTKAISLGFQISTSFGPNGVLSKSIYDIFDRSLDKGRKLAAEICERMLRMMGDPDSGVHVPQVWSIMILLLRNKRVSVDQWEHFRDFVLVLQRCFNCSDTSIKAQAIIAWNRFVFVASPSEATNTPLLKMLGKPILSQFERKKQDKQGQQPGALVWFSYHNLLYYAFRPSPSFQHLDIVWDEYIGMPSSISNPVPNLSNRVAHVLCSMLWSSQAKVWTANKANETHKLAAEELPTLDCRWIRSRITSVLKVFEAILKTSVWTNEIEKSKIAVAWVNLSKALSHASSKEITLSSDSMQAVAHVLGLLQRLWRAGPTSLNASQSNSMDKFFDRFRFLSTTMIFSLGSIPFTEKLLLKTPDETFQAANTPTHRHLKAGSNLDSPILHLLRLISHVPGISEPTSAYVRLINDTLQAACNERKTRGSRLELLRQCADLHPDETEFRAGMHNFAQLVWKSTAQLAADSLCSYPIESARARDGSASRDYENSVKILSAGLKFSEVNQEWNKLTESLVRVVRTEKCDREIATTVVEPLAQCMMASRAQDIYLPLSSLLSHSLSITYCQDMPQMLEAGPDNAACSANDKIKVQLPRRLVDLMDKVLLESYEKFDPSENAGVADYIESLTSFMGSGAPAFRSAILAGLRQTLALWLKDDLRKVNLESGVESRILTACRALSSAVLNILQTSSSQNSEWLNEQEGLICAGIESSHMSVAKRFTDFWNSTFSSEDSPPCPESINRALERLQSRTTHQISVHEVSEAEQQGSSVGSPEKVAKRADMLDKSRIAFILDNSLDSSNPGAIDSSPVTKESTGLPVSLEASKPETHSPEIDDTPDLDNNGDAQIPLQAEEPKRSDVFSMIDNLRSSSPPSKTPKLGFMTPPHLRNLRNAGRETGTPQTPTLPTITNDNDDPFLGSSPTPHTRGRAQATASALPQSLTVAADDSTDPPSSPPEINCDEPESLETETPQSQQSGSKKSKKNKKKKKKQARNQAMKDEPRDSPDSPRRAGTPLTKRLRSSAGKDTTSSFPSRNEKKSDVSRLNGSPLKNSVHTSTVITTGPSKRTGDSRSPSKKGRRFFDINQDTGRPDFALDDCIADSFSDDMETQIASQLEQDLEFAVDASERQSFTEPAAKIQPPMTRNRKRKRETEQFTTPTNKERRRSSRFSFTNNDAADANADADADATKSTRSTRSKKQVMADTADHLASSPAESARRKRRRQSKDGLNEVEATPVHEGPGLADLDKESHNLEPPSSQSRRSSRLSGQNAPVIPEELPPPYKRPSNSRSRKQHAKNQKSGVDVGPADSVDVEMEESTIKDTQDSLVAVHEDSPQANQYEQATQSQVSVLEPRDEVANTQPEQAQADDIQMNETEAEVHPFPAPDTEQQAQEPNKAEEQEEVPTDDVEQPQEQTLSPTTQTEDIPIEKPADMGLIMSLQKLLDDAKSATLDRESLKQVDDLLFNIRIEAHEALRRNAT